MIGPLLAVLLIASCNEDPTSIGSQLIPGGDYLDFQVVNSYDDTLQQNSSYFTENIDLKRSTIILLGKDDNLESWMLMRFYMLFPDSILSPFQNDSINILSTKVEMRPSYYFGDSLGTFDFTVHKVYTAWTPGGFNKDSMDVLDYDAVNYASSMSITDSVITFDLESSVVIDWLKRTYDESQPENHGLLFKPTANTTRIFGFPGYDAYSQEFLTRISIVCEKQGEFVDTVNVIPFSDVHAVKGTVPPSDPENIMLQAGLASRGSLYFDLSRIPLTSVVNRATIQLFVDTLETVNGSITSDSVAFTIWDNSTEHLIDSTVSFQYAVRDIGQAYYEGEVTKLVQEWINGTPNEGFRISLSDEARSVNHVAIKGSNSADPAIRPRLKVIYSKKM